MKIFKSKMSDVGSQFTLRMDSKYRSFWDGDRKISGDIPQIKIGDLIKSIPIKKISKAKFEDESYILNISDAVPKYGKLEQTIQLIDQIGSDKNILDGSDFIVSKLCMSKGYIYSNENKKTNLIGSTELIPYVKRNDEVDLVFLRSLLLSDEYLKVYDSLETGKTPSQKRVNPLDFLHLPIPNVSYAVQKSIGAKIFELEKDIALLNDKLQGRNQIINEVFASEFNLDFKLIRQITRPNVFTKKLSDVPKSFDLRNSAKYFSKIYENLEGSISKLTLEQLKYFIDVPIRLGASVSPNDYDNSGNAYYISMSSIRNWRFDQNLSNIVSEEYFIDNQKNSSVKKGDIIIARSGEGTIGKVALIEEDIEGIFADFTMRVRLSPCNDNRYFYYYFCTDIFQLLVEREKKGLGNNTNIFPRQIKFFPVINVDPTEQTRIADIIESKLDIVREAEESILNKRKEIALLTKNILG